MGLQLGLIGRDCIFVPFQANAWHIGSSASETLSRMQTLVGYSIGMRKSSSSKRQISGRGKDAVNPAYLFTAVNTPSQSTGGGTLMNCWVRCL